MRGTPLSLPEEEQERAIMAFADTVDRIGEEGQFLAAGGRSRAARYLDDAHGALSEARIAMHRIQTAAADTGYRRRARRRLRALAASVASAGLRDAEAVQQVVRRLDPSPGPRAAERSGWGGALRAQATRATAWSMDKWTGSPFSPSALESPRVAAAASESATLIRRREEHRLRRATRPQRAVLITGVVVAGTVTTGLAGYGGWTLFTALFGG